MSMIVAGVMSGTSADGINVALVRFASVGGGRAKGPSPHKGHFTLLAHEEYPFPAPVRRAILAAMNAELARVADLARLNFLLGELYAEAVAKTARKHRVKLDLIGCHGQTLYHQGRRGTISRTKIGGDVANRGRRGDRGAARRARGLRFSSRGYSGRRKRRAACPVPRLSCLSQSA